MENCKSMCGGLTVQFGIDNKLMTVSLECSRIEEARKYSNLLELSLQLLKLGLKQLENLRRQHGGMLVVSLAHLQRMMQIYVSRCSRRKSLRHNTN